MNRVKHIFCNQTFRRALPAVAILAFATAIPKTTAAASFDLFLISDHTAPISTASSMLSVTTQTAYQLGGFNSNNKATTATQVSNFSFDIGSALSFSSKSDPDASQPSDNGETGAGTAAYIDSEIATWDNSGLSGTTVDADEQIDFGRNSSVAFQSSQGGFTDLILSDLGGLNPFDLSLCGNATCDSSTSAFTRLFAGFNRNLTNILLGMSDFSATDDIDDGGQDQTWLFRFDTPITDYIQVLEFDDRNTFVGQRLQADYIGATSLTTVTPSTVPLPTGLPLLLSGFALIGWTGRRKSR